MSRAETIVARLLPCAVREVPWPDDVEAVFARLAARRGCLWLDSAGGPEHLARWSVLAAEPTAVLADEADVTRLVDATGRPLLAERGSPLRALARALEAFRLEPGSADPAPGFGPGFYGYLSYDLAPWIEPRAGLAPRQDIPLPRVWFGLYETVLALDHHSRKAYLVGSEGPAAETLEAALREPGDPPAALPPVQAAGGLTANLGREEFLGIVRRAREYIAAGDIFQVNLSRRYTVRLGPGSERRPPASLYLALRRANPAPYAAYLDLGAGRAVLSSSPELFLECRGRQVVTRPIKGTRPRRPGDAVYNDARRRELLASPKDRAELIMIVDLERNDLGRVCSYGSVRVVEPRMLEAYASVYHTVAEVSGRLHDNCGLVDLLKATFPGGSITGAPKVRAMQIIAELEPTCRSAYTGAIGYLAPPGAPGGTGVLNIAIRTLLLAGGSVHLQVGGGIVADSDPEAEFQETCDKARAMLRALGLAPDEAGPCREA